MKKRVLSLVLCLIMALSLIPTMAFAGSEPITKVEVKGMQTPIPGESTNTDSITITSTPANAFTVASIKWFNLTDWTSSDKTFKEGKEYRLDLVLAPKAGYNFPFDPFYYTGVVTINGIAVDAYSSNYTENLSISSNIFTAIAPKPITKVNVLGAQYPVVGAKAGDCLDFTPADSSYTFEDVHWSSDGEGELDADYVFQAGMEYYISVTAVPAAGYVMTYDTEILFNGGAIATDDEYTYVTSDRLSGFTVNLTAVTKPAKPTISSLSNGSTGITVKWNKVSGATGYQIYHKAGSGSWKLAKTITSGSTTSWVDANRTNGTKYQYKVRAYESVGGTKVYGNYSAIKTKYFVAQPKISSITNTSTGITVKWNKITGATAYRVYRKVGTGDWKLWKTVTGTSVSNTGLTNGNKYQYKIVAVRKVDGTNYTSAASAIKTMYRLTRPTISSATNVAAKSIKVTWNKNTKVTGYQVKYIKGTTAKTVTVKGASSLTKTLSSLTKGSTYKVYVRSYKTVSGTNYYSAWSGYKSVKVAK